MPTKLSTAEENYLKAIYKQAEKGGAPVNTNAIARELSMDGLVMETLAGLIQLALLYGDIPRAMSYVEEILAYLDQGNTVDDTQDPFRIYLSCYTTLLVAQDPRAQELLQTAYDLLQERANFIVDPAQRSSFLENIASNCAIMQAAAQSAIK